MGLCLLTYAHMPVHYWLEAFQTAAFLTNRIPTAVLFNISPSQNFFCVILNYQQLRVFGYACYPHLRPDNHNKFQFRSAMCVFLGYPQHQKGYPCLADSGTVFVAVSVSFNEEDFPFSQEFLTKLVSNGDVIPSHFNNTILPLLRLFPILDASCVPPQDLANVQLCWSLA